MNDEKNDEKTLKTRVGAYAVCTRDGQILLSRYAGGNRHWSLPGGGPEHGEHPIDGVVRETREETGYSVRVDALLGVDSAIWDGADDEVHAVLVVYQASIIGGELTHEVNGSSDRAAWFDFDDIETLEHSGFLDRALRCLRERPTDGRV